MAALMYNERIGSGGTLVGGINGVGEYEQLDYPQCYYSIFLL